MRWRDSVHFIQASVALASFSGVVPTKECPIHGQVYPSTFDVTKSEAIRKAKEKFPQVVDLLFSSGTIDPKQSYFTIDVYSTATNESFYQYSHTASGLNGTLTAGVLNDETIWRVGSVSKLYTTYALLAAAGLEIFDHPVTRYLPELSGNSRDDSLANIIWEDVTVGALASQQAGSGGVPLEIAGCLDTNTCTVENFLAIMKDKPPVTPPWGTPEYSDGGFATIGRVLERVTGMEYEESIHNLLSIPLGLNSTSTTLPPQENLNALVIKQAPTTWGYDNQMTAPSGGIYANNSDLRKLGLSILHNELLSEATTRQWMTPRGHTSTLTFSVGAPWEIDRMTIPVTSGSKRTRVSDLYSKGGGNPPYFSIFSLSPDHGIGFSIQIAGPTGGGDRFTMRDKVAETFLPAAEVAAEANAAENFIGTFVDDALDANMTLTIDEGLPGLGMKEFYLDDLDMRVNITSPAGGVPPPYVRLYPSGSESSFSDGTVRMLFNAIPYSDPVPPRASIEGGEGIFDHACTAWFTTGFYYIQGHILDQFTFHVRDGRLTKVEWPWAGATLTRVD